MKLNYNLIKRRLDLKISLYNFKLYKLFLFNKLLLVNKIKDNLYWKKYFLKDKNKKTNTKLLFYNRSNTVPLRLLRYSLYLDQSKLKKKKLNKLITNKLLVYNGKKLKPINIFKV